MGADGDGRADRHALDPVENRDKMPKSVLDELERIIGCVLEARRVTVGIAASAAYLPERWMTAAEISDASGIPEQVLVEKFGLRGKHIAAEDEHVSDLSVKAAESLLARGRRRPCRASTPSSTSARCGRTTRSGRPRRGSRTASAA